MTVLTPTGGGLFQQPPFPVRRFTVDEYHRMIQAGILGEDDRVELLAGWIVPQMPRNPPHDATIDQAQEALRGCLPSGWRLRVQSAITLADSEPEPDLVLAPGPASLYHGRHPGPQDVALVIEVTSTSLDRDRREKGPLYAEAGLPVYWIINLVDGQVEVYTDPSGPGAPPGYGQRQVYGPADTVPVVLGGQEVGRVLVQELFS